MKAYGYIAEIVCLLSVVSWLVWQTIRRLDECAVKPPQKGEPPT